MATATQDKRDRKRKEPGEMGENERTASVQVQRAEERIPHYNDNARCRRVTRRDDYEVSDRMGLLEDRQRSGEQSIPPLPSYATTE